MRQPGGTSARSEGSQSGPRPPVKEEVTLTVEVSVECPANREGQEGQRPAGEGEPGQSARGPESEGHSRERRCRNQGGGSAPRRITGTHEHAPFSLPRPICI